MFLGELSRPLRRTFCYQLMADAARDAVCIIHVSWKKCFKGRALALRTEARFDAFKRSIIPKCLESIREHNAHIFTYFLYHAKKKPAMSGINSDCIFVSIRF